MVIPGGNFTMFIENNLKFDTKGLEMGKIGSQELYLNSGKQST